MKPRTEGAAWDLQPDTYEMVNEPGSERSEHYQPEHMHPEFWPGRVMGWDYTGGAMVRPAQDQLPAGSPPEAREDDMRDKTEVEVNYDRLPNYVPQQVVGHDEFQLPVPRPPARHRQ
jgi:hypothetical protein